MNLKKYFLAGLSSVFALSLMFGCAAEEEPENGVPEEQPADEQPAGEGDAEQPAEGDQGNEGE
ncbi:hypothetical protein [Alkalihalobacillus sp. AL-G]|uniref:hypothetical protein n=1 Tax=Alkalihalobacillus sp. AL-G TaxID=2926399 RepID=UPI00272C8765|nr:hypothetical protein [Alkalihalobacillus sp. AL-G]WLD94782.1 hypothetical protein MOJ78_07835 [Alkalihalobacillus sp. AL-G]